MKLTIYGGGGFICSHVFRCFVTYPQYEIINLNKLTYASNLANLKDMDRQPNYRFIKGDITDVVFKYDRHSPYTASKASSNHFVRAYHDTYGPDAVISNCSNNYDSHHFIEKLIPLAINNIQLNKPIPVYGKGDNIGDWLWVEDHARAIDVIGGRNEWKNIDLIRLLCRIKDKKLNKEEGSSEQLNTFEKDRSGHDQRYAIDSTRLHKELGRVPSLQFEEGLEKTVDWYLANGAWLEDVTSGNYQSYYKEQYQER